MGKRGKEKKEGQQMTWNVGTVVIPASCWKRKEGGGRERTKNKEKNDKKRKNTWNVGTVVIPASCWSITAGGASLAYLGIGIILLRHWYPMKAFRHMRLIKV